MRFTLIVLSIIMVALVAFSGCMPRSVREMKSACEGVADNARP